MEDLTEVWVSDGLYNGVGKLYNRDLEPRKWALPTGPKEISNEIERLQEGINFFRANRAVLASYKSSKKMFKPKSPKREIERIIIFQSYYH